MSRIESGNLQELLAISDQIGGKIDVMILPAVEGLNSLGFKTWYSCQGHRRTSEVDANKKYPFVMIHVGDEPAIAAKQRLRLDKLATFYNKIVPEDMHVTISHNINMGFSDVNFGENRSGAKGQGRRLLDSQRDSIVFGTFCRGLALGKKETRDVVELIMLMPIREFDMPDNYPQLVYNANKSFETDYFELMQVLRPKSLTFDLMQEGMGL
jgi:hypothetical protein